MGKCLPIGQMITDLRRHIELLKEPKINKPWLKNIFR